jgi:hypothetical protein
LENIQQYFIVDQPFKVGQHFGAEKDSKDGGHLNI